MPRCRPTRERNRLFIRCVSQLFTDRDNVGDSSLSLNENFIFSKEIYSIEWILKLLRRQTSFAMKATLMGMKNSSKELSSELDVVGESCY
ncbi:unnamed protein product, partial [Heterotrigona itama]